MTRRRVADYIAQFLVGQGVQDIFMLTGNGAMYLNDAIAQSNIHYYCARNEAAAPMMAEAYARVKQSLGAVCLTAGPGSTNAVPGLAEAWVDAAPVFIVSGQVQRSHTTHVIGLPGLRSFGTAEINIVSVVRSLTKYAVMVTEPTSIRYHLERAAHAALNGRPGPVWLDIPMDVQYAPVESEALEGYTPPSEPDRQAQPDDDVEAVIALLREAKRPLVIGGHGLRQGGAVADFRRLVERLGVPVTLSRLGLDLMPFSHPLNCGPAGMKGSRYGASLLKGADVVLSLGCRLAIPFVGHQCDAFAPDAKVIMVDIEEAELKKPGVPIHRPIHAHVSQFLQRLLERLAAEPLPDWSHWAAFCEHLKTRYPMVGTEYARNPIDLYYFMARLDALSGPKHIFITDAGSNYYVGGQVFRFEHGQREITSGTFAAMGLGVPLAIGASVAAPDAQILAVTGDGSLELNIQELKTISHYGLNIKLFVINNGGYVSMLNWQDRYFEGRRIDTPENTGVGTLNLKKIAAAFDLPYAQIGRYQDVDGALQAIMAKDGPLFVEVLCDTRQKIVEPIQDLSDEVRTQLQEVS